MYTIFGSARTCALKSLIVNSILLTSRPWAKRGFYFAHGFLCVCVSDQNEAPTRKTY